VASLEARLEGDGNLRGLVTDSRAVDPQSAVERAELRQRLFKAIEMLGEKERVVTTFFCEGLTLREIGRALNLIEGRISQIHTRGAREAQGGALREPRSPA
jgi:RNA polymerase sigma factor FliA